MTQPHFNLILLFVNSPTKSANFYGKLFGIVPREESPTFALFCFSNGMQLGLWSKHTAEPSVTAKPGATELSFETDDVNALYSSWTKEKISIAQEPTDMDFGRTFVALDPDGHRIRAYTLHKD